jgi:hypothetical protein
MPIKFTLLSLLSVVRSKEKKRFYSALCHKCVISCSIWCLLPAIINKLTLLTHSKILHASGRQSGIACIQLAANLLQVLYELLQKECHTAIHAVCVK